MTAEELIDELLELVKPTTPRGPTKKSLAQKQGARNGGRTRMRRQYTESAAILMHYYHCNGYDSSHNSKVRSP